MALQRLVYVSTAARSLSDEDLEALAIQSKASNARRGVTGLTVFNGRNFMQALEGEGDVIGALFQRIASDDRHSGVVTISETAIEVRAFSDWVMFVARVPADAGNLQKHLAVALPADIQDAFGALARLGF